jgi:hypothetical protein
MSFLNPFLLFGAAAVAVPVIIHLIRREKAKRVKFSSLMFLRRIPQKVHKRRRLRNLLLFILRTAALLLLVFAFARPYLSSAGDGSGLGPSRSVVVLLDCSFSMRYEDRFQDAIRKAEEVIRGASEGTKVALVRFSTTADVVTKLTTDRAAVLAEVGRSQPTYHGTDFFQALRVAGILLKDSDSREKVVYLVSDFQQTGLRTSSEPFGLPPGVKLEPVDVAAGESNNLAITEATVRPVVYTSRYEDKLIAKVTNYGSVRREANVSLKVNDRLVADRRITLDPGGLETIEFSGFNLNPGANRVSIEADSDKLAGDDRFFLSVKRGEQTRIQIIEDSPSRGRAESFFLQQALLASDTGGYAVTSNSPQTVDPSELHRFDVILLLSNSRLGQPLADAIKKAVAAGAGLVIVLGQEANENVLGKLFGETMPSTIGVVQRSKGSDFSVLTDLRTEHPVFRVFADSRTGNFSSARFYGYVELSPKDQASVLARFDSGAPALVESASGRGKVLLFASTLDTSWNNLPLTSIFVPFVHQMISYLKPSEQKAYYRVGDLIGLNEITEEDRSVSATREAMWRIENPSGERLVAGKELAADLAGFTPSENGFYSIRSVGAGPRESEYAAVNLDSAESDLKKMDVNQLISAVQGGDESQGAQAILSEETERELAERQQVWRWLLVIVLLLLVAEAVLADRIYFRKRVA